jgi:ankyrin repeat protein
MDSAQEFLEAVKKGMMAVVEASLEENPNLVNARSQQSGASAVLLATYYGHSEIVRLLLEKGADLSPFEAAAVGATHGLALYLEKHPQLVNSPAPDGFTLLGLASFFGHTEIVRLLLSKGADPDLPSSNSQKVPPLCSAAAGKHLEIAHLLLERGANVNVRQERGFTPLMSAADNGDYEMAQLLLTYYADVNTRNDKGKSALDIARDKGFGHVESILLQYGAK